MEPRQQRVLEEKSSLDIKISSLLNFLNFDTTKKLNDDDLILLKTQLFAMFQYSKILGKRIAKF